MNGDKVVVVMGAGDATGGAVAERFAREGYIACVSRPNPDKLKPLVGRIKAAGGRAVAFGTDGHREEQIKEMFRTIEKEIG